MFLHHHVNRISYRLKERRLEPPSSVDRKFQGVDIGEQNLLFFLYVHDHRPRDSDERLLDVFDLGMFVHHAFLWLWSTAPPRLARVRTDNLNMRTFPDEPSTGLYRDRPRQITIRFAEIVFCEVRAANACNSPLPKLAKRDVFLRTRSTSSLIGKTVWQVRVRLGVPRTSYVWTISNV